MNAAEASGFSLMSVNRVISVARSDVRFSPDSDQIAASHYVTRWAMKGRTVGFHLPSGSPLSGHGLARHRTLLLERSG